MKKYKMVLQYVGTRYHGWQTQRDRSTVQACLQDALLQITREKVAVVGAGRTDSGVHALGQVAHFRLKLPIAVPRVHRALNGVLPWDIRVLRLAPVSSAFHAQKDAIKKRYDYKIFNGAVLSPFLRDRVLFEPRGLEYRSMARSVACLAGTHDFSGYAASQTTVKSKVRTIHESKLLKNGHTLTYRVIGNGFLHHMVRNIIGTALEVGRGRRPEQDLQRVLDLKNRRLAGPTAPPQGLYLNRIWY